MEFFDAVRKRETWFTVFRRKTKHRILTAKSCVLLSLKRPCYKIKGIAQYGICNVFCWKKRKGIVMDLQNNDGRL
jgi:hypothetical protein